MLLLRWQWSAGQSIHRIARSQTLALKEEPYIHAAILAGDSSAQILVRHVLPNMIGPVLVTAMLDIGTMMMELAGLPSWVWSADSNG